MDTKDWAAYRGLFTDVVTVHHCHTPEIDVTSPDTAAGIWAMEDMLRFGDGSQLHGFGHYHETYRRADRSWRIASTTLTRLRMDLTASAAAG